MLCSQALCGHGERFFGVGTPTGTGCSRWRSLLIRSSACEAAESAPGGVLQADSARRL